MKHGEAFTAANMDSSWIGTNVAVGLEAMIPGTVQTLNDADAAGIAEMAYGAGKGERGLVLMLTFGTGIGSALFIDGVLVPNTEFGRIEVDGHDGEKRASASAREREELSYPHWAKRGDRYLDTLEKSLWPDLIVVGGGVSKKAEKWVPLLSTRTKVGPAQLLNDAGIVGAALAAEQHTGRWPGRGGAGGSPSAPRGGIGQVIGDPSGTESVDRRRSVVTMVEPHRVKPPASRSSPSP